MLKHSAQPIQRFATLRIGTLIAGHGKELLRKGFCRNGRQALVVGICGMRRAARVLHEDAENVLVDALVDGAVVRGCPKVQKRARKAQNRSRGGIVALGELCEKEIDYVEPKAHWDTIVGHVQGVLVQLVQNSVHLLQQATHQ
jgi:hypothetical protein